MTLLVPATSYLLFYGYYNEFYSFPKFWFIAIPFAVIVIISIPILFKIGKLLQHGEITNFVLKSKIYIYITQQTIFYMEEQNGRQ